MGLFIFLLIALAVAWGLGDFFAGSVPPPVPPAPVVHRAPPVPPRSGEPNVAADTPPQNDEGRPAGDSPPPDDAPPGTHDVAPASRD